MADNEAYGEQTHGKGGDVTDDLLLAELSAALQAEREVPGHFVDAGKATFTWHSVDAELAALMYDSALEQAASEMALTRAEPATLRALTYATAELTIELEVTEHGLLGQVVPAQPATVQLHLPDRAGDSVSVDEIGWFTLRPIPAGRFRLACTTENGKCVVTDWIVL